MSYPNDPNYPQGQPPYPPNYQRGGYPGGDYPPSQGYPPSSPYPPSQGYPPSAPYPLQSPYPPSAPYPQPQPPTFNPTPVKKRSNAGAIIAIVASILLVSVIGVGITVVVRNISHNIANVISDGSYSATVPGKGCDKGLGDWGTTKEVNFTQTCAPDGIALTRTTNDGFYSELFFNGRADKPFTDKYQVKAQGTITGGGPFTFVGLEAHDQGTTLARQIFEVASGGQWDVLSYDTSGTQKQLAIGFLKTPATTYTLEVDVDGSVVQFMVNGQLLTTVTDTSFFSTDQVGLVFIGEKSDQTVQSAKFANFSYTPQGKASLTADQAGATATATITQRNTTPYTAAIPGPGCDTGTAQWAAPALFGVTDTPLSCGANGLVESQDATATSETGARFYWLDGHFTANYSLSATIQTSQLGGGCAGFSARSTVNGRYGFFVCDGDGSWYIAREPQGSKSVLLKEGTVPVKATHTMKVTVSGSALTLVIDNKTVGSATDVNYTTTRYVQLLMFAGDHVAGSATFSNFVFTPLP